MVKKQSKCIFNCSHRDTIVIAYQPFYLFAAVEYDVFRKDASSAYTRQQFGDSTVRAVITNRRQFIVS